MNDDHEFHRCISDSVKFDGKTINICQQDRDIPLLPLHSKIQSQFLKLSPANTLESRNFELALFFFFHYHIVVVIYGRIKI